MVDRPNMNAMLTDPGYLWGIRWLGVRISRDCNQIVSFLILFFRVIRSSSLMLSALFNCLVWLFDYLEHSSSLRPLSLFINYFSSKDLHWTGGPRSSKTDIVIKEPFLQSGHIRCSVFFLCSGSITGPNCSSMICLQHFLLVLLRMP